MKNNSSNLMFMMFMFMGIMISISSNNWFGCWMGIEMNLVSFLPIMMDKMSIYSSESMIKYFIIQSMGSSLLFISFLFLMIMDMNYLIMVSLLIKIGCPPFHLWFPSVMEGLSWLGCFFLSTTQKLAPMILMTYLMLDMMMFIIMACCWGSIGGLAYSSMRKIIAYSSIYNLGWIISGISILNYSWIFYFFIYSVSLMMLCYSFYVFGVNYLNQFFIFSKSYFSSIMMMILFLSMGGLPPFLGFIPKLVMIYCLALEKMFFLCFILLMSALMVMFFYLRVVFTGMMVNFMCNKMMIKSFSWLFYIFSVISLFGMLLFFLMMMYM